MTPLFKKFFNGPKILKSTDHLLIEQGSPSTKFLVTFIGPKNSDDKYDPDLVFASKNFRKLNQKMPDSMFDLKFWYVQDSDLASKLGIKSAGDVYLI